MPTRAHSRTPVVVVTGASQGIGAAIARAFSAEVPGVRLALVARSPANLACVARSCASLGAKAEAFPCDVSNEAAVAEMEGAVRRRFGAVDVLVNNAGKYFGAPLLATSAADFDRTLAANLRSLFLVTKAFAPAIVRRRRGDIFNMGSIAGLIAYPGGSAMRPAIEPMLNMSPRRPHCLSGRVGLHGGEVWRRRAFKGHARRIQGQGGAGVLRPSRGHHLAVVEGERGPAEADDAGRGCGQGLHRRIQDDAAHGGGGDRAAAAVGRPVGAFLAGEDATHTLHGRPGPSVHFAGGPRAQALDVCVNTLNTSGQETWECVGTTLALYPRTRCRQPPNTARIK